MPNYNSPADQASIINDLQRRLRVLETSARVKSTNTVIPELVPSNGSEAAVLDDNLRPVAYDTTWRTTAVRESDSTTVGLPSVTVSASMVLVLYSFRWTNLADLPEWYSDFMQVTLALNGSRLDYPWLTQIDSGGHVNPVVLAGVFPLASGPHQFQVEWQCQANPDASSPTIHAHLVSQSLAAIPVKF